MINILKRLWFEESGQGLAEYGLILALIAVVCIGALVLVGGGVSNKLTEVANQLK